jgi:hypothetical protein
LGLGENQSQAYQLIKDDDSFFFVGMSGSVAETLCPRPASNVETGSLTLLRECIEFIQHQRHRSGAKDGYSVKGI